MIKANKAKELLIKMLKESGFDFNSPNPKLAWKTFKEFSNIKVNCADDALLFQCGVHNFTGEDLFHFEFVRQFGFEDDHMEQLSITLYFESNTELKDLKKTLWLYDSNSVDEFFGKVENMNQFKIPIENYVPFQCEIEQEEV